MFLRRLMIGWIALAVGSFSVQAQVVFRGRVVSGDKDEPLPFANVFLANTTRGTTTDENGRFTLSNLQPGRFEMVVSYVGFETLVTPVQTDSSRQYLIRLKPAAGQLAEVTIKARRGPGWKSNLAFFVKNFIGQTPNARQCRLLNPETLWFNLDPKNRRLTAGAREPLLIENKALGYRLKYQLELFDYNSDRQLVTYLGYPVLENLPARNIRQRKRWEASRRQAYMGSTMHFMRSLFQRRLREEGFAVQQIVEKETTVDGSGRLIRPKKARYLVPDTLHYTRIIQADSSSERYTVLKFDNLLQVSYSGEREEPGFVKVHHPFGPSPPPGGPQISILHLVQPSVLVEANGNYYEPLGLLVEGYWSWEKIAELLPLDYEP